MITEKTIDELISTFDEKQKKAFDYLNILDVDTTSFSTITKNTMIQDVKVPFDKKDEFKQMFPSAKWDNIKKVWQVNVNDTSKLKEFEKYAFVFDLLDDETKQILSNSSVVNFLISKGYGNLFRVVIGTPFSTVVKDADLRPVLALLKWEHISLFENITRENSLVPFFCLLISSIDKEFIAAVIYNRYKNLYQHLIVLDTEDAYKKYLEKLETKLLDEL